MPKKEVTTQSKIEANLFKPYDQLVVKMTKAEYEIMLRYQQCFEYWNEHPDLQDVQISTFLMDKFDISKTQSYRDIAAVEKLLGSIKKTNKEWTRYRVTQLAFKDHALASAEKQYTAAAILLDKIIKANKLDQPDADDINWDDLENPSFEPTSDVRVLDPRFFNPDIESIRSKLRAKYKGNNIEEATYTDVKNE